MPYAKIRAYTVYTRKILALVLAVAGCAGYWSRIWGIRAPYKHSDPLDIIALLLQQICSDGGIYPSGHPYENLHAVILAETHMSVQ